MAAPSRERYLGAILMHMSTIAMPRVTDRHTTGPLSVIRGHPMASFLFLVFALTWTFQIPWIASTEGWVTFDFPVPLLFVMGWMPGLAAVIVTGATSGRAGVRSLLGRIFIWRV